MKNYIVFTIGQNRDTEFVDVFSTKREAEYFIQQHGDLEHRCFYLESISSITMIRLMFDKKYRHKD